MFKKTVLLLLGSSVLLSGDAAAQSHIFDYLDDNQYDYNSGIDQSGGNNNINYASEYLQDPHAIFKMDDKENYGTNKVPVQKFRQEFIALATQSVKEEAKKYGEALDALMKERAKIYLLHRKHKDTVDMSPENNKDIQHIVSMTEYKEILKEEQHEFQFFYQ